MALWQAALEYARQPAQAVAVDNCMRSHPHENMSLTCQLKTEIERLKKERNVYKEECEKAVAKYNRLFFKNISNVFLSFLTPAAGSPHPDDEAVDKFASAMKQKLAQAREKGRSGWQQMTPDELSAMLYHHVEKGDPRDVANFCMFLWNLGQPITPCKPIQAEPVAFPKPWGVSRWEGDLAKNGLMVWFFCEPSDDHMRALHDWIMQAFKTNPAQAVAHPPADVVNERLLNAAKNILRNEREDGWFILTADCHLLKAAIAAAEKIKGGV